ncbi:MAG: hypothetical protein S4CHLAM7_03140 [Chlamydiae bacterium]|nr:hypothetical protein [Chlamydiota bacterium]
MKIAVLAYGSLVLNLKSQYYDVALKIIDSFSDSGLTIPTSFQDISLSFQPNTSRVCLLALAEPSEIARFTKLYYASHEFEDLNKALENMMSREGTSNKEHIAIFRHPSHLVSSSYSSESFSRDTAHSIEGWLIENSYDIALIAQFPTSKTPADIQLFLNDNEGAQKRTLSYFLALPRSTQEAHKNILKKLGIHLDLFEEDTL